MDQHSHLSRRERQIMDVIYALGRATVNDIQQRLPDPPTHTAVRTLLRILEDKGVAMRSKRGRELVYTAKAARGRAGVSALKRVVQTFFEGSFEKAVSAHLASRRGAVSPEELERLESLIAEARKRGC